jgi:hypothetical protein
MYEIKRRLKPRLDQPRRRLKPRLDQPRRRLKPRLDQPSPDGARTEENNIILNTPSSTRAPSGFCLCRRGFNRRRLCQLSTVNCQLSTDYI